MYLETERLIVRDYEERDRDAYYRLKPDDRTMYYLQDIRFSAREESDQEFTRFRRKPGEKDTERTAEWEGV